VQEEPAARLLDDVDAWLDSFRRRATSERAPASARRALTLLEAAVVDLCRRGGADRVQSVLVALGRCEQVMARSLRWVTDPKTRLAPVPPLSPAWLCAADDGSPELRLAASLASVFVLHDGRSIPLRSQMEPVTARVQGGRLRAEWDAAAVRDVVWVDGELASALNAVLARRLVLCGQWIATTYPDRATQPARRADIAAFIEGRTDDARVADLLWGTILIDWSRCDRPPFADSAGGPALPALYGLLKLCFPGASGHLGAAVPVVPRIHRLAASGDGAGASRVAVQRLRASGLTPAVQQVHQEGIAARRAAAAVLFPLAPDELSAIRQLVLRPRQGEET
jgi:CRISPR-associated protein Csx17